MSGTLNKVMLIGHLGDEVKLHYFDDRNCVGRFPLATNETYTNRQTNERVTNTEWHNIVLRNKAAEICAKYLKKGDRVYIEGRISKRSYEKDGVKQYFTEVVSESIIPLDPRDSSGYSQGSGDKTNQEPIDTNTEDDLPF